MNSYLTTDLLPFALAAVLLILYLVFSAATEMGTKFPWNNSKNWNNDKK